MAACHAKPRSPEITQGSRERRPADKKREIPRQFPLNSIRRSEVKPSHKSWLAASGALLSNLVLSEINSHANITGSKRFFVVELTFSDIFQWLQHSWKTDFASTISISVSESHRKLAHLHNRQT
ncbi:hypothetical protein CEXT_330151 [Caerostris extrusa]|uniref:Uncharacterized protein n=1 Tax=Caerostris extrusa TaxID=172846 RepID=A0AAV4TZA1_CAEEX|nr:hypothetical protein CEXT_330151 [Caerostris extrusa]